MVEFRKIPILLMLRVTWLLEDIVDKLLGVERGARFYPSAVFENVLMKLRGEEEKC